MKKFLLLFFAVVSQLFFSQIEKHVKLNYDIKSIGENQYEAIITAKIDNGWHIYSKDIDPEVGAIPTEIKIISKDIELIGKATESGKKETSYSEAFAANLTTLSGNVVFKQKFKLKNPEKGSTIAAEVTYQTCNEKVCLAPETLEFEKKIEGISATNTEEKTTKKPLQKTVQKPLKQ
jgi:thiol:disulfide interchange protein DsbD